MLVSVSPRACRGATLANRAGSRAAPGVYSGMLVGPGCRGVKPGSKVTVRAWWTSLDRVWRFALRFGIPGLLKCADSLGIW